MVRVVTHAASEPEPPCRCRCPLHPGGCPADAHKHHRPGSDCGCCGPDVCPRYRPQASEPGPFSRALARVRRLTH